jgi:hypothetical protein
MKDSRALIALIIVKTIVFILIILGSVVFIKNSRCLYCDSIPKSTDQLLSDTLTIYTVASELECIGVQFPEVVACQAALESGHFKSSLATKYNNLFGMKRVYSRPNYQDGYVSTASGMFGKYPHWITSCWDYKLYQDMFVISANSPEEYLNFLQRVRYAEDPNYINKLKKLYDLHFIRGGITEERSD